MNLNWINPSEVEKLSWVAGRNRFANMSSKFSSEEILKKYVYLSSNEVEYLLNILKSFEGNIFKGVGVELGAGVAIFSALVSKLPEVSRVYAVELVPDMVKLIQPRIIESFGDAEKVMPTLGSFDDLRLESESCDFIIEYDSLHHSFNLDKTLSEAFRVLKPGGYLIAFDRIQHDKMAEDLRKRLLNFEYSQEWLAENFYDDSIRLTREANGEHEIKESEWVTALSSAGFSYIKIKLLFRPCIKFFLYSILSMIPDRIKKHTRYKILSAYPFYSLIISYIAKNNHSKKFINCLGRLQNKNILIKGLIIARK